MRPERIIVFPPEKCRTLKAIPITMIVTNPKATLPPAVEGVENRPTARRKESHPPKLSQNANSDNESGVLNNQPVNQQAAETAIQINEILLLISGLLKTGPNAFGWESLLIEVCYTGIDTQFRMKVNAQGA